MYTDFDVDEPEEENYYTFLNLPKNATTEQINSAYRKLSRIYHPDKHMDNDKKEKAEVLFNRIKKAYEVLSDPNKRAIYDNVGVKGLHTDGWELVQKTKTSAEIREEYEHLAQIAEERKLQQRTNPRGNVVIHVNATEIFSPYDIDEFPKTEVSSMSISQSIDTPITLKDTITLSGNLYSSNGNGGGGFLLCGRRLFNKGWLELDVGAGNGTLIGFKGGRSLSQIISTSSGVNINFRDKGVVPSLFSTLAVQLDKHTVGSCTLNVGSQSSMTTQLNRSSEKYSWSTSLVIGTPHIYFNMSYTHKLVEHEMKLRVAAKVGTFGFLAEYGAEKKVSKYSSVFASVSLGIPTGVILKFKISRSNQVYEFPIHLSEEIIPAAIFYATVTPLGVWFILKKTILDPMNEERKRIRNQRTKAYHKQEVANRRDEALAAVDLMQQTYERNVSEESKRNGMIIQKAIYGMLNDDRLDFKEGSFIDVTIPVQCQVKDSKLELYSASKNQLPGFYDPCFGETKVLKIEYIFRNNRHVAVVNDNDPITLPSV